MIRFLLLGISLLVGGAAAWALPSHFEYYLSRKIGVSLADYNGNWVTAMAAAQRAGNLIYVPQGTWPVLQVVPYSGLTIKGAGKGMAIVVRNAAVAQDNNTVPVTSPLFKVNGATNVTISDITIRGFPIGSGTSDDILIDGVSATGLKIQRVNLENSQGIGIQLEGATGNMKNCLVEDVTITNILFRVNGAHGVGLWLFKGTHNCTFRRITTNGTASGAVFLDAGTTGSVDAASVDNNTFKNITINNPGQTLGAIGLTGANNNTFTTISISNLGAGTGPAFTGGVDQSGLGTTGNTFTTVTLANINSGDLVWLDPAVCGNTWNGVTGNWGASDPSSCNTFLNSPGLTIR